MDDYKVCYQVWSKKWLLRSFISGLCNNWVISVTKSAVLRTMKVLSLVEAAETVAGTLELLS